MAVSVIASNFNGARYLPRLLQTLQAQRNVTLEIIVVDRLSSDESPQILKQFPEVQVITEPPETGLVAGYHAGSRIAKHPLFFFCNEDMWFDPDCLAELEKRIDLHLGVGIADPWQWTYDQTVWLHGGVRLCRKTWDFHCPYPRRGYRFTSDLPPGTPIPFACAGAMLIHRDVYQDVGGWDTGIFLDNEDVDLGVRLWQAGWKIVTVPNAKVYHAVNASNAQQIPNLKQPVKRRRYISGRMGVALIAFKTFSPPYFFFPIVTWWAVLLNDIRRFRWRMAWCDCLAAKAILLRLNEIREFRRKYKSRRLTRPGEQLFSQPEFNE